MNKCLCSHNNISQGLCLVLLTNETCLGKFPEHSRSSDFFFFFLRGREGGRKEERKKIQFPRGQEAVYTIYFHHPAHEFFMENL